jgi:hypothetical protein
MDLNELKMNYGAGWCIGNALKWYYYPVGQLFCQTTIQSEMLTAW